MMLLKGKRIKVIKSHVLTELLDLTAFRNILHRPVGETRIFDFLGLKQFNIMIAMIFIESLEQHTFYGQTLTLQTLNKITISKIRHFCDLIAMIIITCFFQDIGQIFKQINFRRRTFSGVTKLVHALTYLFLLCWCTEVHTVREKTEPEYLLQKIFIRWNR